MLAAGNLLLAQSLFILLWVKLFARHNKPCHKVNQDAREGGGYGGEGVNEANESNIPIEKHGDTTTNACYLAVSRTIYTFICIHDAYAFCLLLDE